VKKQNPPARNTSTTSGTYDAGNYGVLRAPTIDLPATLDDDWGLNFRVVESDPEPEESFPKVESDERTNEDLQREARALIDNALEWPPEVVEKSKVKLRERVGELRDYVMTDIVPFVLSVNPALNSVKAMVPGMFEDGAGLNVDMDVERMQSFAYRMAVLAVQTRLMDTVNLPPSLRERVLAKMMPLASEQAPRRSND